MRREARRRLRGRGRNGISEILRPENEFPQAHTYHHTHQHRSQELDDTPSALPPPL